MYNKIVEFDNFEDAKIFTKQLFADNDFVHNYSLSKSKDKEIIIMRRGACRKCLPFKI